MKSRKECSRRDFLRKSLAGAAGAGILGFDRVRADQNKAGAAAPPADGKLITRTLGKTGFRVPVVGMGVMNADVPAVVRRAYELGIRHFDTAAGYSRGRNEEMVGSVVKELGARDKVIIATKIRPRYRQPSTIEQVKASYLEMLDASLKRLQTDYVDILYVHDISDVRDVGNPGLLEGMAAAKKAGKARAVGFSTHQNMGACLDETVRIGGFDVILTAYNYAFHQDARLLESMNKAAASGIGLVAMKTQCQQDWYREGQPDELQTYYKGAVVHSALLKWVLNHDCVAAAIPGFVNFEQLDLDIPCASSLAYTPVEKKFLEDRQVKLALAHACHYCGDCSKTCPFGADVPGLMRAHMYAFNYGNPILARETLAGAGDSRELEKCRNCEACRAACSGGVRVGRRIEQLKQVFA
jgi:aryl-alcohol dehydrogenase-like predicted oxidoreductase